MCVILRQKRLARRLGLGVSTVTPWQIPAAMTLADGLLARLVNLDRNRRDPRLFPAVGAVAMREVG